MDITSTCPPCPHHGLSFLKQAWIVKYLLLGWGLNAIAKEVGVTAQTVYNAQNNMGVL
jgi:hypothetical protein